MNQPSGRGHPSLATHPQKRNISLSSDEMAGLLARQQTEAEALHADVQALRRRLAEPPPPVTRRSRDHRPLLAAVLVGGSLATAATIVLVPWTDLAKDPSRTLASSSAQPLSLAVPAQFVPGPLGDRGPGIDTPGVLATVRVGADGSLSVVEQAVLGPRGARELVLQKPDPSALAGPASTLKPRVTDLRVAVNDQPVPVTETADGYGVRSDAARARTVRVSYTLTDAVSRTNGSRAGRAVGLLTPLLGSELHTAGLPYRVSITGGGVSGISCPTAPAAGQLCGSANAEGWTADLPDGAGSPMVLLQLNL